MANFVSVSLSDVVKVPEAKGPSQRSVIAAQFRDALMDSVVNNHSVLRVDLSEGEGLLTTKNRITKAGEKLGLSGMLIVKKVRGENALIAYSKADAATFTAEAVNAPEAEEETEAETTETVTAETTEPRQIKGKNKRNAA